MAINSLIELSSSENLYKDCWLTKKPKGYEAPSDSEIASLWNRSEVQNYLLQLNDEERQNLRKHTKTIEDKVPMITSNGNVLNIHHRLYLSYLIARLFIYKEVVSLEVISSIVIYPTFKLRKVYNESGLVICKGINSLLKPIKTIYNGLDILIELGKTSSVLLLSYNDRDFIKKTYTDWREDMKYVESIINKKQIYFKDKIETKIEILKEKITIFETEVLTSLLAKNERITPLVEVASIGHAEITKQLELLKRSLFMMEETNAISMHLSWQAILQNLQNNGDLVVHEMAHVIDFYNGGLNGVPSNSRKFEEIWKESFSNEKEENSFLNPYAFKNELEYFAVTNESFFKSPELLKKNIPTIYDSLKRVYGYVPNQMKGVSKLEYLKLNFFSNISVLKI